MDWRDEIIDEESENFKLADKETRHVTFKNEGIPFDHKEYGKSVVFALDIAGQKMNWYISAKAFSTLRMIKALGTPLTGQYAKISRTGTTLQDTRYTIEKAEKEGQQKV